MPSWSKGRSPFYPGQPVPAELFVGRRAQIDRIMTRRARGGLLLCAACALLAAGCGHPISKALREKARGSPAFPVVLGAPEAHKGATVVWGGVIVEALNREGGTDITVLETPLSSGGRPQDARDTRGRFIARSVKFLDPAVYKTELKLTVGGEVVGQEVRPLGEMRYTYPVVEARELYLWPEEREPDRVRYHIGVGTWYHPYWGPYYWR